MVDQELVYGSGRVGRFWCFGCLATGKFMHDNDIGPGPSPWI